MTEERAEGPVRVRLRFLITLLQLIAYIPIQVVFIPFALLGLIDGVYREVRIGKRMGVSFTAIKALQYRWIMHHFDTRQDQRSVAFTKALPCESHFGLWSIFGALVIAQRVFGLRTKFGRVAEPGEETFFSTPGRRLLVFDRIVEKHVDEVDQIVIPGAGFDLIALRFTEGKEVRVFELDQVGTMTAKVETLRRAGIRHDWVTYIPVDYQRESWIESLVEAGFDSTKKTLFLWQSVSLFLRFDVVRDTLIQMGEMCIDGSKIAQDFYSSAFASGDMSRTVKRTSRMMGRMGEPWRFGIDMSGDPKGAVAEFLGECGLKVTEIHQFGEKRGVEPFYCIVVSEKTVTGALKQ